MLSGIAMRKSDRNAAGKSAARRQKKTMAHVGGVLTAIREPAQNKFEDADWRPGVLGAPILANVLASLECALETTLQGGDHAVLIGRVKKYSRYAGNALLFAQGR
jgi:flavin reductase (DIM6/NTAB) family NADH-FMN oxidoreductase RutF